jgi:ClpP class serine protease
MKAKLFQMATGVPWLIRQEALQGLLEIAARENLFTDDIRRQIEAAKEKRAQVVAARGGRPLDGARRATVRDGVATIPVIGPIFRYADFIAEACELTTIEGLATDFDAAIESPSVRSILLEIDSPGGQVAGTGELAATIAAARARKPIVAYGSDDVASAAYWLASAAQEIVAAPTSAIGSIGVVVAVADPAKANSKTVEFVSSQSPRKRPDIATEGGRSEYQRIVDDLASVFIADVARNRSVSEETVLDGYGGGGLLIGRKAVEAGLADRLGSYESVFSDLASGRIAPRGARPEASKRPHPAKVFNMDFKAIKKWFGAGMPDEFDPNAADSKEGATPPTQHNSKADSGTDHRSRADTMSDDDRAELHRLREEKVRAAATAAGRIKADAEAFASSLIRPPLAKIKPYEAQAVVAGYVRAAQDDLANPTDDVSYIGSFGQDGGPIESKGTRLDALKASYMNRPSHGAFDDLVADSPLPKDFKVHDNNAKPKQGGELQSAIDKYARAHGANGKN